MAGSSDRVRTLLVGFGIIAVVASLASYFAWRADQAAGREDGASPPPSARSRD